MDFKLLYELSIKKDSYSLEDAVNLTFMNDYELENYQVSVELDDGELSQFDHLRYLLTMKNKVKELNQEIEELKFDLKVCESEESILNRKRSI